MEWTKKREKILIRVILSVSVLVALIDFLPGEIQFFEERIPAMILFVLSVITAIQTLETKEASKEREALLEKISKRFPVEIAQADEDIRRMGIDAIQRSKHNIKLVILGPGAYSSTNKTCITNAFFEALKLKINDKKSSPFTYQCILSYGSKEDSKKIKDHIDNFAKQHPHSVEYRFLKEKRINLNIVMIDNTELIISFTSSGENFYKVFRFDDNESVANISYWFSSLWSQAETIDSLPDVDVTENVDTKMEEERAA